MFELIESSPDNRPGFGWTGKLISVAVHGFVISAALAATRGTTPHDYFVPTVLDSQLVWQVHEVPPGPPPVGRPGRWNTTIFPMTPIPPVPNTVPTDIPQPGAQVFVEPGFPPAGDPIGVPGIDPGPGHINVLEVREARLVDEMPQLVSHPEIRYPEMARQAGMGGRVMVETVLDTLGRADRARTRITSSPHALFDDEAIRVVIASRYSPGRVGGRAVPVRVQVPVSFTIRQ